MGPPRHLGDPSLHRWRNTALSPLHSRRRDCSPCASPTSISCCSEPSSLCSWRRSFRRAAATASRAFMRTRGFFLLALLAALWLSLGIAPQTLGRPLNLTGLYQLLYSYIPGFDGLRVPARFNMIGVLMLAVLGGYGAAALSRWRWATPALVIVTTAFFAETLVRPFPINGLGTLRDYATPEARVYRPARAPAVYRRLAQESGVVLAELPLGQPDYDIRAMFYSIVHHARLLNGYSGFSPPHYGLLTLALSDVPSHAMNAWDALRGGGVTHVHRARGGVARRPWTAHDGCADAAWRSRDLS